MFLKCFWFSLHYMQHIICNIIYGILYTIWYEKLFVIRNNQSLLIGTIIGYKQSSERAIEDLTYTPISDSKFSKWIRSSLGSAQAFKGRDGPRSCRPILGRSRTLWRPRLNYILRLRYTFLKMRNRIVRSRCYNKRPVGSFRWSRYQSNCFGWKIRNQNQKWSRIWRPSHCNLFTFQFPSYYYLNFTVSSKYILKIFLKRLAWKQIRASHRCWWRMLETKCVGDKFEMLVTDLHCENHQHNEKKSPT